MAITNNAAAGSQIRLLCMIDRVLNRRLGEAIPMADLIELLRPEMLPVSDGARNACLPKSLSGQKKGYGKMRALASVNSRHFPANVICPHGFCVR